MLVAYFLPFIAVPLVALVVGIACLPLSLCVAFLLRHGNKELNSDVLLMPGLAAGAFTAVVIFLGLEILWIPFGVVIALLGVTMSFCYNKGSCNGVYENFFQLSDDDNDQMPPGAYIWFLPVAMAISFIPSNDD